MRRLAKKNLISTPEKSMHMRKGKKNGSCKLWELVSIAILYRILVRPQSELSDHTNCRQQTATMTRINRYDTTFVSVYRECMQLSNTCIRMSIVTVNNIAKKKKIFFRRLRATLLFSLSQFFFVSFSHFK